MVGSVPRVDCGGRDVVVTVGIVAVVVIVVAIVFVGVMLVGKLAEVRWMTLPRGCCLSDEKGSSVSVAVLPLPFLPNSRSVVLGL